MTDGGSGATAPTVAGEASRFRLFGGLDRLARGRGALAIERVLAYAAGGTSARARSSGCRRRRGLELPLGFARERAGDPSLRGASARHDDRGHANDGTRSSSRADGCSACGTVVSRRRRCRRGADPRRPARLDRARAVDRDRPGPARPSSPRSLHATCETRRVKVAVIGAGRLGTAMAVLLGRAGHRIVAVSGRGETRGRASLHLPDVPCREPADAAAAAELVIVGTPDDVIVPTVEALAAAAALGPGRWACHLSGSLGLDALAAARDTGARVLAIHPLQTFPDVGAALDRLPGCPIAVTAEDRGGVPARRADRRGPRRRSPPGRRAPTPYHAAAVFASNYAVTASATPSRCSRPLGCRTGPHDGAVAARDPGARGAARSRAR